MDTQQPAAWRRARPLLGTLVEIAVHGGDEAAFVRASDAAFACVARHHAAMSFHEAASDVRRIADAAPGTTLAVAPETRHVLAAAFAFEAESGGVFDVAVGDELIARGHLPATPGRERAPPVSARAALRLEADGRVAVLRRVAIDLGGIAKGAAVDAALAALRAAGARAAAVNAGGDMALFGETAQPIGVRGPNGLRLAAGTLADGAIATSGPYDGDARSSLVSRHADPARWADRAVSVVAPTCIVADALTKVLAVLGPDAAPLLARHGAHGFSVDARGRLERVA